MTPLEVWQDECSEPLFQLQRIVEKRKRAVIELAKMGAEYQSLQNLLGESMNEELPEYNVGDVKNDPTHYLSTTENWLNIINKMCTQSGILAITAKIKEATVTIAALKAMDGCFTSVDGTAKVMDNDGNPVSVTQVQAWGYLHSNVAYYIQQKRDNERIERAAGYPT